MNPSYIGEKLTFRNPLGFDQTIRELNGEDEEILSTLKNAKNLDNLPKVISMITTGTNIPEKPMIMPEEIERWPVAAKYYAALKMRLHNHGSLIAFSFQHDGDKKPHTYEEDLNKYDRDLSKPAEAGDDPEDIRIKLFPHGADTTREVITQSGKKFRYTYLNTLGERMMSGKVEDDLSANDRFRARFLEFYVENEQRWITVQNFAFMSARDTRELRSDIKKNDVQFSMQLEIKSPETGEVQYRPAILLPSFFFPEETL